MEQHAAANGFETLLRSPSVHCLNQLSWMTASNPSRQEDNILTSSVMPTQKIAERIPSTHSSALIIDTSLFVPVGNQLLVDGLRNQIHADMFAIYPPIAFTNSLVNSRSNPVLVDGRTSITEIRMLAPTNTEDKRNISVLRFPVTTSIGERCSFYSFEI